MLSTVNNSFINSNKLSFGLKLTSLKNMYCPVCDRLMLNGSQINEFVQKVSGAKGYRLYKILEINVKTIC